MRKPAELSESAEKMFSDVSSLSSSENLHPVQPHIRLVWKITLLQGVSPQAIHWHSSYAREN